MSEAVNHSSVLIVDAYPLFRLGLRHTLHSVNGEFQVVGETSSGQTALELARSLEPDLLILDLTLKDVTGVEILRRLSSAGVRVPILTITGNLNQTDTMAALQWGVRGVVPKDVEPEVLIKCVRAVLAGEYWIGRSAVASFIDALRQKTPASSITPREQEVIQMVLTGLSNMEVGNHLGISQETVKRHIRNIYDKMGISSRMELALRISPPKARR